MQDPYTEVDTFASPLQQRRYRDAMEQIASRRRPGAPVRVYISARPPVLDSHVWERRLAWLQQELPDGIELLHYRNSFTDGRPYDWPAFAETLDGLVVMGRPKRRGSRVIFLGPVARLELRALVAHKPVLLHHPHLGLVPVIDCRSQGLGPAGEGRLKLTAPKRWKKTTSPTWRAAQLALRPVPAEPEHLTTPFTATTPTRADRVLHTT